MEKTEFVKLMDNYGEACVHYISPHSEKEKYVVGTIHLDSCDYIKEKRKLLRIPKPKESAVLMFCWDTDSFRQMEPEQVKRIIPLQQLLNE